jgi:hypothetical protein
VTRDLVLPEVEPEDISVPRLSWGRRTPTRRTEHHHEKVEVE